MRTFAIAALMASASAITLTQLQYLSAAPCAEGDKECAAKAAFAEPAKNATAAFAAPCKEGDKECAAKAAFAAPANATAAFAAPCKEGDKECAAKAAFAEPAKNATAAF